MLSMLSSRDELSLSNLYVYLKNQNPLDTFIYYANNAIIKGEVKQSEVRSFRQSREAILRAESKHGIKLLSPLKILLQRMLDANWGFTELHSVFLVLCHKNNIPSQALFILEYPGFFKHLKKKAIISFIDLGSTLLIELEKYKQAYEFLRKITKIQFGEIDNTILSVFAKFSVLANYMGEEIDYQIITSLKDGLKMEYRDSRAKLQPYIDFIDGLIALKNNNQVISQNVKKNLVTLGLYQIYQLSKQRALRQYIQKQIKGNSTWRIKATTINNQKINDYEVIKSVNNFSSVYKYDSKNQLMYFNHKLCDQNELNQLISKSFLMQQEVNNCKIERKEEFGMGGMGGMGRMGGMGGMMGMLSGMGGMGRSKRGNRDTGAMMDSDSD